MVKQHYEQALAFYEQGQYYEAIEECDEALTYNPNSSLIKDLREKAKEDLKNRIVDLVEQAHKIEKEDRIDNALDLYRQALPLSRGIKKWESLIKEKIRQLEGRLSYDSKLRRAAEYEMDREWDKAAQLYQEAMQIAPNNKLLRQKYNEAKARSNARRMDMTPEVREIYLKGYSEMTNKNYEEAIRYFRQALDIQPHNVNLWGALDYARSELRKKRAASDE
ncbi:MAG: tetratricopeptide repeat protein [candidate division KSB1 bacterium]|nr:tetratricopeptide repeat protein [candidate division KSB1 bacterium]